MKQKQDQPIAIPHRQLERLPQPRPLDVAGDVDDPFLGVEERGEEEDRGHGSEDHEGQDPGPLPVAQRVDQRQREHGDEQDAEGCTEHPRHIQARAFVEVPGDPRCTKCTTCFETEA